LGGVSKQDHNKEYARSRLRHTGINKKMHRTLNMTAQDAIQRAMHMPNIIILTLVRSTLEYAASI